MTKLAPEWVRTSDPVIRSPARYRWTTAPAYRTAGVASVFVWCKGFSFGCILTWLYTLYGSVVKLHIIKTLSIITLFFLSDRDL